MEQQFSLSWNNFHGNLTKGFAGLLGNGEFVDVTIAVDGHLLQAHKVILSICSPYFKKMFQMNPCQHPIIVLRDVTHKAMRDLLQFMYHGEVSVKREDLTSFIGTAEVLQIKGLTNKETEEDENEIVEDLCQKDITENVQKSPESKSVADNSYNTRNNDSTQNTEIELFKQRQFMEKLQRLSNLKRKSEEFLQKNYYADLINSEKRPKLKDKSPYNKQENYIVASNYDSFKKMYEEQSSDIIPKFASQNKNNDLRDKYEKEQTTPENLEVKTECDDSDIIVTDPAICKTPNNFENLHENQKDYTPLDYQSPQDNCSSLSSLFMDLKNLVNGKVTNDIMRANNTNEEFPRQMMDHRLVTIPQKEDGKKKYPQRSCRLCWKIGKRRDTRFMCSSCELPFCKSPCFDIHINDILKFQGDYYAS